MEDKEGQDKTQGLLTGILDRARRQAAPEQGTRPETVDQKIAEIMAAQGEIGGPLFFIHPEAEEEPGLQPVYFLASPFQGTGAEEADANVLRYVLAVPEKGWYQTDLRPDWRNLNTDAHVALAFEESVSAWREEKIEVPSLPDDFQDYRKLEPEPGEDFLDFLTRKDEVRDKFAQFVRARNHPNWRNSLQADRRNQIKGVNGQNQLVVRPTLGNGWQATVNLKPAPAELIEQVLQENLQLAKARQVETP